MLTGSHDIAVELLTQHLKRHSEFEITSSYTGSLGGLMALARGEAHVAGCHLLDEESGEYNLPFVKRLMVGVPTVVVTLVERTQGLIVPTGNPKGVGELADVIQLGLRFINRQKGSGTRVLLDFLLKALGTGHDVLNRHETDVDTHLAVAEAVASGRADAGLGILAAARAFDLDFVPVRKERYDLVMTRSSQGWPQVKALRNVLDDEEFKAAVHELGGYDTTRTGSVLAEVDA
jgi:putative molybdopterin biosynthesis protein